MHSSEPIVYNNKDLEAIVGRLRFCFIWPKSNRPEDVDETFYLKAITFYGLLLTPGYTGLLYHLIIHTKGYDMSISLYFLVIMEALCIWGMFVVYLSTLKKVVGYTNLYSTLDKYVTYNYDTALRKIQLVLAGATFLAACYRYLTKSLCLSGNYGNAAIGTCGYFVPVQYPFNFDRTPFAEMILLYQVAVVILICRALCPCIMLMIFFVDKVGANLRNIQSNTKNLSEYNTSEHFVLERVLRELARDHKDVISKVKNLNSICRYINLVFFVMGSMIVALMLLCVFVAKMNKLENSMQSIFWLGTIYICSRYFQTIIDEGENVAVAFYEIRWYEMSLRNQKLVYVMLIAGQRPLGIHAGPFQEMSLASFLALVKTTYSYLNLLVNTL